MPAENPTIQTTSGWVDRSNRARIEVGGPDRAKFLHNLTTNDVKRLQVGQGQESFVTTPQGKILAYITLHATAVSIILRTETASLEGLAPHLAKYGVFDDVLINDISDGTIEIHVFGPEVGARLGAAGLSLPDGPLRHKSATLDGHPFQIVQESLTVHPGLTLIVGIEGFDAIKQHLETAGLRQIDGATFDSLRIEGGTPLSGRDVTLSNLPQEVGRDSKTINFVKGCYLGQETVARLDALGHVNRILKGLTLEGSDAIPPDGSPLTYEGKPTGMITSAAYSTSRGYPVALGYVKVAQAVAGTKLSVTIEGAEPVAAVVRDLPL